MHKNEGTLRAYLDGELDAQACAAAAAHLRECAACRKQLESLASRTSATSRHLQALAPRPLPLGKGAELPAPAPVALARLHKRLANEEGRSARLALRRPDRQAFAGGFVEMFKQMFNTRYRAAWAGLAAILVVASLLTLAPVQAAASQFLSLFRVRKFAVVSVNPASLQNLEKAGGQIDKLLSDSATFVKKPSEPITVTTAAEATQKAGIPVRLPTALAGAPRLMVQDGVDAKIKIDLARVRAILEAAGRSDVKLPDSLDGASVEFIVPPMAAAQFGDCPRGLDCVSLVQLASPTVDAPAGVNVSQMGEAMLQLLGLSPDEARHFAQAIDWSSTLVIPIPTDAATFRDVTVDGVSGVLVQADSRKSGGPNRTHYTLLWQKNDVVYALSGTGDPTRAVEIADSLK